MNEKQAREIYDIDGSCMAPEGWEAKGYLEAIEKAKGLEEALFKMQKEIDKWKALAGELLSILQRANKEICNLCNRGVREIGPDIEKIFAKANEAGL